MTPRIPAVGERVLCDGQYLEVRELAKRYHRDSDTIVQALRFENANVAHYALVKDMRWSDELSAWYMWGRLLSYTQAQQVAELRDRHVVVARARRQPGHVPAGGEHLDLYLALYAGQPAGFWDRELRQSRTGTPLSEAAAALVANFRARWLAPHTDGYADPVDAPTTADPTGAAQ